MKAIITLPNYDDATAYLYCYAEELITFAQKNGVSIIQLRRPRLRRDVLESSILEQKPELLLFNAHGDEKTIYGDKIAHHTDYLIREDKNHEFLEGRLTYARACSAAASLGKKGVMKSGCFIGYTQPFSFWIDTNRITTPLKDKIAQLFLQPSNDLALSLLKGKTAGEAANCFNISSQKNILQLLSKKDEPGAMACAMLLWNNMEALEVLGNEEMRAVK